MRKSFVFGLNTAMLLMAAVAFAQMAHTKTGDSAKGKVLTDSKGMTPHRELELCVPSFDPWGGGILLPSLCCLSWLHLLTIMTTGVRQP